MCVRVYVRVYVHMCAYERVEYMRVYVHARVRERETGAETVTYTERDSALTITQKNR